MSPEISERSFEEAIECGLLEYGPDACASAANVVRGPERRLLREERAGLGEAPGW